jgi:hypothetical protein
MLIAFFAALAVVLKVAIFAIVTAVCSLFAVYFGFILVICTLDWWNSRNVVKDIPFVSWRKRL